MTRLFALSFLLTSVFFTGPVLAQSILGSQVQELDSTQIVLVQPTPVQASLGKPMSYLVVNPSPRLTAPVALTLRLEQVPEKPNRLANFLLGEAMMALVSTPGLGKDGAYWLAGINHVTSLVALTGPGQPTQDETRIALFSMLNALAVSHYFIKPTSGKQVFLRNLASLNVIALTTHLVDRRIARKKGLVLL